MKNEFEKLANQYADQYQVPRTLLAALINQESAWNPNAVSSAGAQGLTQLMPGTAKDLGVTNPFDPEQSISGGARYLAQQKERFGDWNKALAAYNAGPGNVQKYGGIPPFKETQNYVNKIMSNFPQERPEMNNSAIAQLNQLLQPNPKALKRQRMGEMLDAGLSGLASIAGSFHPTRGSDLQNMYSQQYHQRSQNRQAQRKSAIKDMMDIVKSQQPNPTDDIREFEYARQQGYQGSFFDFQKELRQAGAAGPLDEMVMNSDMFKNMFKTSNETGSLNEDQQAIEWAKQNPNDPRAQQILTQNGVR